MLTSDRVKLERDPTYRWLFNQIDKLRKKALRSNRAEDFDALTAAEVRRDQWIREHNLLNHRSTL